MSRAGTRPLLPAPAPRLLLPAPAATKGSTSPPAAIEGRPPIKRLTSAEQEERRRLGLCYNCDEKFSRGHNRVCKRLFFLDGTMEDDDTGEPTEEAGSEESPAFSLQAIAGVRLSNTMQVHVQLGTTCLVALLDSRSTHNFISDDAAQLTGLPLQLRPRLTATVTNGERVSCVGVARNAAFSIHSTPFRADLYVMPLAGFDMVLGTQWLATLGPIVWDFSTHTVFFQLEGRELC